jgi:hypothetical protein
LGKGGAFFSLLVGWLIIWWIGVVSDLPYQILPDALLVLYEIFFSLELGLPLLVIVGLLFLLKGQQMDYVSPA